MDAHLYHVIVGSNSCQDGIFARNVISHQSMSTGFNYEIN